MSELPPTENIGTVIIFVLLVTSVIISAIIINKSPNFFCSTRKNVIRGFVIVWGFWFGEFIIYFWHPTEFSRIGLGFSIAFLLFLFTEFIIGVGFLEFFIFHREQFNPHCFDKSIIVWRFFERHEEFSPVSKARIILNIFLADEHDKEVIEVPLRQYLALLCAATKIAQREWIATYQLSLDNWQTIKEESEPYFAALEKAEIKKSRFAILGEEEIRKIIKAHKNNKDLGIVEDTLRVGAVFYCIDKNDVNIKKDYAIFDEYLVITLVDSITNEAETNEAESEDYLDKMVKVLLLKGDEKFKYVGQMKSLLDRVEKGQVVGFQFEELINPRQTNGRIIGF